MALSDPLMTQGGSRVVCTVIDVVTTDVVRHTRVGGFARGGHEGGGFGFGAGAAAAVLHDPSPVRRHRGVHAQTLPRSRAGHMPARSVRLPYGVCLRCTMPNADGFSLAAVHKWQLHSPAADTYRAGWMVHGQRQETCLWHVLEHAVCCERPPLFRLTMA